MKTSGTPRGNKVNKARWWFLLPVLLTSAVNPVTAVTLSLQQALEQALLNNPGIERQRRRVESEQLEKSVAQAKHLPELSLQAGVTHYSDPTLVWPIHERGEFPPFDEDIANIGINLRLPLYVGGKLVASVNFAEKMLKSAELQLQASQQELIFNVVSSYGKTLQLQQLRAAMQHRILGLESQLNDSREGFRSGRVAEIDVARVKTRLSEARYDMVILEQGVSNSLQFLATLMGSREAPAELDELPDVPLSPSSSLAHWTEQALDNHPGLRRAQTGILAADERLDIARSERLPQIHLVGSSRYLESSSGEGQDEWQVGVQLSLPLYDGSSRRDKVSQAVIARQMAQLETEELRDNLHYQVREAHAAVTSGALQITVAEQGLREAEEVLRIETLRHQSGAGTITDLLSAESDLWHARAKQMQARYDLIISKTRLLKVVGILSPAGFSPGDSR